MRDRPLDVLVMAPGLAAAWPVRPRDLLTGDAVPLTGAGWPLRARILPEAAGAALALDLPQGGRPAVLWLTDGGPGWLARACRAAGFGRVVLHPVGGADPAPLVAALDLAGIGCETAAPVAAPAPNAALAAALPHLADLARAARRPAEQDTLCDLAQKAASTLNLPWPDSPQALAARVWPLLAGQPLMPPLPGFDPQAEGPAGLTGKRITLVIEKLADRSGGAERVLIDTANALAGRGHMIEILSHEHRGKAPFYATVPGVRLANLRPRRESRSSARRFLDMLRAALERQLPDVFPFDRLVWLSRNGGFHRRLGRHLAVTRPDAVIAFMPPAVTALALAEPGVPLRRIASMHNAPEQDFDNPDRWDPSALDRRRRRAAMARMDVVGVLLDEYRDWYPPAEQSRIRVIPNAVTPVDPAALAGAARGPVVLAVGRLAAVKRHGLLIGAWARIIERFPGWELRIFGEGPLREALEVQVAEAGVSDSVRLMGHTAEIGQEYLSAALLAHPAEFEGFPLAVTEALAAGLPVLGFDDCSGLNRLVADGVNGQLVAGAGLGPDKRQQAFAAALERLMADGQARAALSAAAPGSVAHYAPDRVVDLWEDVIFGPPGPATQKDEPHG